MLFNWKYIKIITIKKPEKTNEITDIIFLSVILPTKILLSVKRSVYTDRKYMSVILSVYTDGYIPSVSIDQIIDELYSFLKSCNGAMTWFFSQTILLTEWPMYSNQNLCTVMWHIHRQNHRWFDQRKRSVGDSIGKNQYIPVCWHSLPLSPLLLPHPTSPLPNYSQPPIPTPLLLNTS